MPSKIEVFGHCYEARTVLLRKWDAMEMPELVRVNPVVLHKKMFLLCSKFILINYTPSLSGFFAELSNDSCLLPVDSLTFHIPQTAHRYRGHFDIILQGMGETYMFQKTNILLTLVTAIRLLQVYC